MNQQVFVYAFVKENEKVLLLKRSSVGDKVSEKFELPGGKLPFGHDPDTAIKDYIYRAVGKEVSANQLSGIVSRKWGTNSEIHQIIVVYMTTIVESTRLNLSRGFSKYVWKSLSDLHQEELTETTIYLVGQEGIDVSSVQKLKNNVDKKTSNDHAIIYCDGGSRGNPGPSASGFIIQDSKQRLIEEGGAYLGITTNNQAEYQAVLLALEAAKKRGIHRIEFRIDSLLVVNQMNGSYKIKNRDLWPIHEKIKQLIQHFTEVAFLHIRREYNTEADAMVNKILDEHTLNS